MWSTIGGREGLTAVAHPTTVTYCQRETFGGRERDRERLRGPPLPLPFLYLLPCLACSPHLSNQKRPASGAGWRKEGSEWLCGRRGRCDCSRQRCGGWRGGRDEVGSVGMLLTLSAVGGGTPFMNTRASGRVYVAAACVVTPALFLSKQR